MESQPSPDEKQMRLRYAGRCRVCDTELVARTEAVYERATKTVRCLEHGHASADDSIAALEAPVNVDAGTPGASARREYERRHQARQDRVRERHPRIGGLLLALVHDPQSTNAWNTGAVGEERLGIGLDERASERLRLLHDRRIPRSRANIDHIAVAPSGVWVIDAKKYRERPRLKVEGGILSERREKLLVGSRNCTSLVVSMIKQMNIAMEALGDEVPMHGALCFIEADWPLLDRGFAVQGVHVLRPKVLYPKLEAAGPLSTMEVADLHQRLASALPPA